MTTSFCAPQAPVSSNSRDLPLRAICFIHEAGVRLYLSAPLRKAVRSRHVGERRFRGACSLEPLGNGDVRVQRQMKIVEQQDHIGFNPVVRTNAVATPPCE